MKNILEDERLELINHSGAHLLAQAVKRLYPKAMFWVGPAIREGFYYDIDLGDESIAEEDLEKLEKEMKKIVKEDKLIKRLDLSLEEALAMFKGDPYKEDLLSRMEDEEITAYQQGEFIDLCRGPHVRSTKELKHFKLLKVSGAYWKGDANNKMLQRVYGIVFDTKEELDEHLKLLEEAKERDHRKLGKDLGIFMTNDLVGKGLPMYLPNGYIIWNLLEDYIKEKERKLGYAHVLTPPLGSVQLYKTSGHWDHYKDDMFPAMQRDGEEFVLRPMNCPHHMMIYKEYMHSYKELPIRIGEIARDLRYEASGALKGIERSRCFCQNDAHLFVTADQIKDEFDKVVKLILEVYEEFDITDYKFQLSLRDPEDKEKYFPDDAMWESAEAKLREVLDELEIEYSEEIGEAAFYGPKLDVQVKPAVGNEYTLSTCQLDFLLPRNFELNYIDADGSKQTPVVIHRAILGSIDRFIAYILEETKGSLPVWLAPSQVTVIPVNSEYHNDYAKEITATLEDMNIRVKLDDRNEKLAYRMREAQTMKVPFTLILGEKEIETGSISYRVHGDSGTLTVLQDEFFSYLKTLIETRSYHV